MPAQRHERDALLGRLQAGVDRRAGRVAERDPAACDGGRKRGAGPCSPSVTAAVSTLATQPAPISMSAWKPDLRHADQMQIAARLRISARTAAMAQPE